MDFFVTYINAPLKREKGKYIFHGKMCSKVFCFQNDITIEIFNVKNDYVFGPFFFRQFSYQQITSMEEQMSIVTRKLSFKIGSTDMKKKHIEHYKFQEDQSQNGVAFYSITPVLGRDQLSKTTKFKDHLMLLTPNIYECTHEGKLRHRFQRNGKNLELRQAAKLGSKYRILYIFETCKLLQRIYKNFVYQGGPEDSFDTPKVMMGM